MAGGDSLTESDMYCLAPHHPYPFHTIMLDSSSGLEAAGAAAAPPEGVGVATGSAAAAEVAMQARPRYHVAAGQDVAFARLPYANRDLGVGVRVTRFVALGPIAGECCPSLVPNSG